MAYKVQWLIRIHTCSLLIIIVIIAITSAGSGNRCLALLIVSNLSMSFYVSTLSKVKQIYRFAWQNSMKIKGQASLKGQANVCVRCFGLCVLWAIEAFLNVCKVSRKCMIKCARARLSHFILFLRLAKPKAIFKNRIHVACFQNEELKLSSKNSKYSSKTIERSIWSKALIVAAAAATAGAISNFPQTRMTYPVNGILRQTKRDEAKECGRASEWKRESEL